mmetsp:Transcript_121661/g.344160  ORF Transcript_121661/g.344160 Transcript_121661/m.344160 type:complete len:263 (-) Transcript_121661:36-824(-)
MAKRARRLPPPALAEPPSEAAIPVAAQELLKGSPVWVVYDLEWTTWDGALQRLWSGEGEDLEVVQIGAVKLDARDGLNEIATFSTLVRPALVPQLSEYFTKLTGITQTAIESSGVEFPQAFQDFMDFVGPDSPMLSWGPFLDRSTQEPVLHAGDMWVLGRNCDIHGLSPPDASRGIDVKALLLSVGCHGAQQLNSGRAYQLGGEEAAAEMESLGGAVGNAAHDALFDARSIGCALRSCKKMPLLAEIVHVERSVSDGRPPTE